LHGGGRHITERAKLRKKTGVPKGKQREGRGKRGIICDVSPTSASLNKNGGGERGRRTQVSTAEGRKIEEKKVGKRGDDSGQQKRSTRRRKDRSLKRRGGKGKKGGSNRPMWKTRGVASFWTRKKTI